MAYRHSTLGTYLMCSLPLLVALLVAGCASTSPTAATAQPVPITQRPVRLAINGQSNAIMARKVFVTQTDIMTVVPTAGDGPTIACWADANAECWPAFAPAIHNAKIDAFVFWQGESDLKTEGYGAKLADLMGRVRGLVGDPSLLIVVMQYGTAYSGGVPSGSELATPEWAAQDAHALYVPTRDIDGWLPDHGHMTDAGYAAVGQRIVSMVRQKLTSR